MENGTMEPGQKGGIEGGSEATGKKKKTGWDEDRGGREGEREMGRQKDRGSEMRI